MTRRERAYAVAAVLLLSVGIARVAVQELLVGTAALRLQLVASDLERPTAIAALGEGLLVAEQAGVVRFIGPDGPRTWLDLSGIVLPQGEMGLLGLALHPDFDRDGRVFAVYSAANRDTVLSAFTGSADGADAATEQQLLRIPQVTDHHKGGALAFGPDGHLYIGIGDDGWDYRQFRIPPTTELRGVVLRLDVDGGSPYAIPAGNPFASGDGRPEIWDHGLRNPWRIAFDGGDLFIGDVGSLDREEIDVHRAGVAGGLNFGWSVMEGSICRSPEGCDASAYTLPVADYTHEDGNCAVIGGLVVRGDEAADPGGTYLYGDLCSGRIWGMPAAGGESRLLLDTDLSISTFGERDGQVYVADITAGQLYRIHCPTC
jgi:glucose/arabinose dehydrogenase